MAVLLETTLGDIVIDLFVKERPRCMIADFYFYFFSSALSVFYFVLKFFHFYGSGFYCCRLFKFLEVMPNEVLQFMFVPCH